MARGHRPLVLQEKRVVSRNWARSPLGPEAAREMLDVEDLDSCTGAFCLGERVDLAVTMENKAEVSQGRTGWGKPRCPSEESSFLASAPLSVVTSPRPKGS